MSLKRFLTRRNLTVAGVAFLALFIGWNLAFEPVTRNLVATDAVCAYCHLEWEFSADTRLSATRPHPATPEGGQATCIDCHLPEGYWNSVNAYLHLVSLTDLFGQFRDIDGERVGTWTPYRAKTAYRVRDQMQAHDSNTCRSCHIEEEIKPKRDRGINAHKLALEEQKTCIECHYTLVPRSVDLRPVAAAPQQ